MTIRDLDQALDALFAFTGPRQPNRSSLEMMARAMPLLDNPHQRLRVIHVTGTSGKTSTSYYIRALLEVAGQRTGLTVSPHIEALNERVQIGGVPLEPRRFCGYLDQLLDRLAPLEGQLTYFELVICLALWVFVQEQVDYAVVEVGIGGLRDATNIVQREDKVAVIGPVGLDHTEKLGTTIAEIAVHKAGIMVPGGQAFAVRQSAEALAVIRRTAQTLGTELTVVDPLDVRDWPGDNPGMLPAFQRGNWALALAAAQYVAQRDGFALPQDRAALQRITPPARYEWFTVRGHQVLLDGAHNPQKVAGLVAAMTDQGSGPRPVLATLSAAPHTKVIDTVAALKPVVTSLIVPEFQLGSGDKVKQSVPADEMAGAAASLGIETRVVPDLAEALDQLLADPAPGVLVTGSLYLAALVRPWLVRWAD